MTASQKHASSLSCATNCLPHLELAASKNSSKARTICTGTQGRIFVRDTNTRAGIDTRAGITHNSSISSFKQGHPKFRIIVLSSRKTRKA
jgi:hypothetical protein